MTTVRSRQLTRGAHQFIGTMLAAVLYLTGLPAVAQLTLGESSIEVDNSDFLTIITDVYLQASQKSTLDRARLGPQFLVIFENGLPVMRVDGDGVTFPDSSVQDSAAYSKAEVDAIVALLASDTMRAVRPRYFLTPEKYHADQALTACEPGFHMASIFELADPSYLVYEYSVGLQTDDSGWGPPLSAEVPPFTRYGWVRTGAVRGDFNCDAWTTTAEDAFGSAAGATWDMSELTPGWQVLAGIQGPDCSYLLRVWCIQDAEMP